MTRSSTSTRMGALRGANIVKYAVRPIICISTSASAPDGSDTATGFGNVTSLSVFPNEIFNG